MSGITLQRTIRMLRGCLALNIARFCFSLAFLLLRAEHFSFIYVSVLLNFSCTKGEFWFQFFVFLPFSSYLLARQKTKEKKNSKKEEKWMGERERGKRFQFDSASFGVLILLREGSVSEVMELGFLVFVWSPTFSLKPSDNPHQP